MMKVELRRSMDGALSHKHAMSMQRGTKKHAASCTRRRQYLRKTRPLDVTMCGGRSGSRTLCGEDGATVGARIEGESPGSSPGGRWHARITQARRVRLSVPLIDCLRLGFARPAAVSSAAGRPLHCRTFPAFARHPRPTFQARRLTFPDIPGHFRPTFP